MLSKLLTQGSSLAVLPAVASSPLCALLLPIAASMLLSYAASQLLEEN